MSEKTEKVLSLEAGLSNAGSRLAVLRGFTEHPGWGMMVEILESQKDARKGEILFQPLKSTEAVYAQEFMKGELAGLSLVPISIFAIMEELKSQVQTYQAKLENEHAMEKRIADESSRSRVDGPAFGGGDSGN